MPLSYAAPIPSNWMPVMAAPRPLALLQVVVRRAARDWPLVAAAWVLLLTATALISATTTYGNVIAREGIRLSTAAASPADRAVVVRITATTADTATIDAVVVGVLDDAQSSIGGEVDRIVRATGLVAAGLGTGMAGPTPGASDSPAGSGGASGAPPATLLASYAGIEGHARLVEGRWPAANPQPSAATPIEATLSRGAAAGLGLKVGQEVTLTDSLDSGLAVTVRLVGVWQGDSNDPYWLGNPADLEGVEARGPYLIRGPFVVPDAVLATVHLRPSRDIEWRALPRLDQLGPDAIEPLRAGLAAAPARLATIVPHGTTIQVVDALPGLLEQVGRSALVGRTGVLLITLQFALLAGYAIVLVGAVLDDRRRPEIALIRARGASTRELAAMAIGEAILVAGTATLVTPAVTLVIVAVTTGIAVPGSAPLDVAAIGPTTIVSALLAGVAAGVVLCLPTFAGLIDRGSIRLTAGRQLTRTLAQRLGLDIALVVLALLALSQLRTYGAPLARDVRNTLGIDPILVGAPSIGLIAGGLLAVRIVPRLAELAERLLVRGRGAVAAIGGRQVARRPLRYSRSALLLILAFALGTYTVSEAATWRQSQIDQAAYQAASDVRVTAGDYPSLPPWSEASAYRSIPDVTAAVPVIEQSVSAGQAIRDGTIVGVNAATLASLAPDLAAQLGGETAFAAVRPDPAAIVLPGQPTTLSLTVDAALSQVPGSTDPSAPPVPPPAPGQDGSISLTVVVRDADGLIHRLAAPADLRIDASGQRLQIPLAGEVSGLPIAAAAPLSIVAIEAAFDMHDFLPRSGTLEVRDIGSIGQDGTRTPVSLGSTAAWLWQAGGEAGRTGATGDGRLTIPPTHPLFSDSSQPGNVFRWAARQAVPEILPAVVGRGFLAAVGAREGDVVNVTTLGHELKVRIAAVRDRFPPLDPAGRWLIVDGPTLVGAAFADDGSTTRPQEWWLRTTPGGEASVIAALAQPVYSAAKVVGRDATARSLTGDPVALGVLGALTLGAVAAAAFAAIGFVVSAVAAARERLEEFALLRALGLSASQLVVWQSLEQALTLLIGASIGLGLGLVLAWLVLPAATLTQSGAPPVPPASVIVPLRSLLPLAVVGLLLLASTIVLVSRLLRSTDVVAILRSGED